MNIIAALLSFPSLFLASLYVIHKIRTWGDDNPSHPGKMGIFLMSVLLSTIVGTVGSYLLYTQL